MSIIEVVDLLRGKPQDVTDNILANGLFKNVIDLSDTLGKPQNVTNNILATGLFKNVNDLADTLGSPNDDSGFASIFTQSTSLYGKINSNNNKNTLLLLSLAAIGVSLIGITAATLVEVKKANQPKQQ